MECLVFGQIEALVAWLSASRIQFNLSHWQFFLVAQLSAAKFGHAIYTCGFEDSVVSGI